MLCAAVALSCVCKAVGQQASNDVRRINHVAGVGGGLVLGLLGAVQPCFGERLVPRSGSKIRTKRLLVAGQQQQLQQPEPVSTCNMQPGFY